MDDVEALLTGTAEEPPCGPDLEYDADFLALEQAAKRKEDQEFGDTKIAAEEPNWPDVARRANDLLSRTKDLRVAVLLARALVRTEGLPGLSAGLHLIHGLLERYWDEVHPRLDPDEGDDPTMRLNALAPMVDAESMLRDLRAGWFVSSRAHGRVGVRDVEVALGKLPPKPDGELLRLDQIEAIVAEVAAEDPTLVPCVMDASQSVKSIYRLLVDKVGGDRATDFGALGGILASLEHVCKSAVPSAVPDESAAAAQEGTGERPPAAPQPITGEIRSRQDALLMLDKVCDYLERTEPTNPAPLLIRRAKRVMTKNFLDILKDLAPDGVSQVEKLAGLDQE